MLRDLRQELRDLAVNDLVPIGAVAREIGVPSAMLEEWLAGRSRIDGAVVGRLIQFLDDRAFVWRVLPEATNAIRQEFAHRQISNLAKLNVELEHCAEAERGDLHDHVRLYLMDLRRLVDLMGADAARLPEALAAALRSLLEPGDKMLIARAGNKAGR